MAHRILPHASSSDEVPMVHRPCVGDNEWDESWGEKYLERMKSYLTENVNSKYGSYKVAEYFGFKEEWTQRMANADELESDMERTYALLCMKNEMFMDTKEAPVANLSFWEGQHRSVTNTTVPCNSALNFSSGTLRPPGEKRSWQPFIDNLWIREDDPDREPIDKRTEDWIYGSNKLKHTFVMEVSYYRVPPSEMSSVALNAIVRQNSRNQRELNQKRAYIQPLSLVGTTVKEIIDNLSDEDIMADIVAPSTQTWSIKKGGLSMVKPSDVNKKIKKHGTAKAAFDTFLVLDNAIVKNYMRTPNDPVADREFRELFGIAYKNKHGEEKHHLPPFVNTLPGLLTSEDKGSKTERLSPEMVNHWYFAPKIVHALMEPSIAQAGGDVTTTDAVYETVEFLVLYVLSADDRNLGKVIMHGALKLYDHLTYTQAPTGENYLIGAATFLVMSISDIFHRKVLSSKVLDPIRGKDGYYKQRPKKKVEEYRQAIRDRLQRFYDAVINAKLMNTHRTLKDHLEAWGEFHC